LLDARRSSLAQIELSDASPACRVAEFNVAALGMDIRWPVVVLPVE
jgi:hypothetical protein